MMIFVGIALVIFGLIMNAQMGGTKQEGPNGWDTVSAFFIVIGVSTTLGAIIGMMRP